MLAHLIFRLPGSAGGSHERRLLNDLMTHYQKLERPVIEESQAVSLKFGLTLQQILDVVRKPQKIIIVNGDFHF